MALFTLGYEGLTMAGFTALLQHAGVKTVFDVRDMPLSHKRGFSKNGMAAALGRAGIGYRHWKMLGAPKEIRARYRADHDWEAYAAAFRRHLATRPGAVTELAEAARAETACLICFEADAGRCHRSIVAEAARRAGGPPVAHLRAD